MKDIAEHFGVSVSTVSRALSGCKKVRQEKRDAICAYAKELNFSPNDLAQSLRNNRRHALKVIGVIVPEITHYYFASVLTGIEETASERGYQIVITMSGEHYERERQICQMFDTEPVCGVIMSQAKETTQYDHFQMLLDKGLPLVFFDRICTGINASLVVVDDYMGAFKAVTHLIETGCRRIAFYGMAGKAEVGKNRYNGYRDALLKAGLKPDDSLAIVCDNRSDAERLTPNILRRDDRPDAFFCVNDDTAIGVMYTAKRMGFNIPDDVAVCGFTNGSRAVACDPQLTTVEQRGVEVGREAANILIDKVEGEGIPVVYTIDFGTKKVAAAVSECTGAAIGTLYSMQTVSRTDFDAGETYLTLMERNYEALGKGLYE